ncbi:MULTISPECIES: hypothetical protein [Mycobacteriaceae]|uniref:hypothetical protein n=1 Tax=Mycobacteriaceae TaxID=1762 RepID=UPI0009A88D65|nr:MULTISPECIES: hypothetical protein [Mycobacteriaceae]
MFGRPLSDRGVWIVCGQRLNQLVVAAGKQPFWGGADEVIAILTRYDDRRFDCGIDTILAGLAGLPGAIELGRRDPGIYVTTT